MFSVDEIDYETAELRWVLDAVLRLTEDDPEHPRLPTELTQQMPVVDLEVVPISLEERLPVKPIRNDRGAGEGRLCLLVRHLEKEQVRELLEVVTVREPIIAEDVAVAPESLDESI